MYIHIYSSPHTGDPDLIVARLAEYKRYNRNGTLNKSNNFRGCNGQPVNALDLDTGWFIQSISLHDIRGS
jgi:hypothetical protein